MPADPIDLARPEYRFEKEAERVHLDRATRRRLTRKGWDIDELTTQSAGTWVGRALVLHRTVKNPVATLEKSTSHDGVKEGSDDVSAGEACGVKTDYPEGHTRLTPTPRRLSPSEIVSLQLLRSSKKSVVIALDTEFYYPFGDDNIRRILSVQLAVIDPRDPGVVQEAVFLSLDGTVLPIERILGYVIDRLGLPKALREAGETECPDSGYGFKSTRVWTVPLHDTHGALWEDRKAHPDKWASFASFEEALAACGDPTFRRAYEEIARTCKRPGACRLRKGSVGARGLAGYTNDYAPFRRDGRFLNVTLLCHYGRADLSALGVLSDGVDVMNLTSEVQRGVVSLEQIWVNARHPDKYGRFYPVRLDVRDTMCFAPAKERRLEMLGEAVGVPKLSLSKGFAKGAMDDLLLKDPVQFMEYASQDSLVTLSYAAALFGANRALPVTASSAGARAVKRLISAAYGLADRAAFDAFFRGTRRERRGMRFDRRSRRLRPVYVEVPLSDDCRLMQEYARQSYKGGLNGCFGPAWVGTPTHDLDLMSAYPTAMACVLDIDWEADEVVVREWRDHDMTLDDFPDGPLQPIFAYVDSFEFPAGTKFPCLGINLDGKLVYPRTLGQRDGVYATGVEIWLALKMGATVHVGRAVQAAVRTGEDGRPTHSLLHAVKSLVEDRTLVKRHLEEQSELAVVEQLLKQVVNSVYGKTAQGVLEKHSWDAFEQRMTDIGSSAITSPAHAAMTTAIVRCVLLAAMTELDAGVEIDGVVKRFESYSCTTDGFITDADEDVVNGLDLMGLAPYLREARVALSGSDKVWEAKHHQSSFLNITTRGNCAPELGGVCAHNGYSSPFEHDTLGDRYNFLHNVLTRAGKVETTILGFTNHRALSGKEHREEFHKYSQTRELSMDYDMKRKPVESTLRTERPVIEDMDYEVACVGTVPYDTPEEFELWYKRARARKCLRTEGEWRALFSSVRSATSGNPVRRHVGDYAWSQLMTCVMGHRLGLWSIPELDRDDTTVAQKCAWVQTFNRSRRRFTESAWKNARRQNRQDQMLPRAEVEVMLRDMGAVAC